MQSLGMNVRHTYIVKIEVAELVTKIIDVTKSMARTERFASTIVQTGQPPVRLCICPM